MSVDGWSLGRVTFASISKAQRTLGSDEARPIHGRLVRVELLAQPAEGGRSIDEQFLRSSSVNCEGITRSFGRNTR